LKKATKERRKRERALKRWKRRRWAAKNLKRKQNQHRNGEWALG